MVAKDAPGMAKVVGQRGRNGFFHTVVIVMDAAQQIELKRLELEGDINQANVGPYSFDRRRAARTPATGRRLGVVFGSHGGRWLLPFELRDTSANGLGLVCDQDLHPGDRVTLYDEGRRATFIKGRVTRCLAREDGKFDLGLTV
ncbi:MAG: hypothetical protein ACIAS6_11855 [Phycisphaerales bacterium JB060]